MSLTMLHSALTQEMFDAQLDALTLPNHVPLAVAVSGGADSITLTLLMADWCTRHHHPFTALTVDHGFRSESTHEADTVHTMLTARGIHHTILTNPNAKPESNLMEEARKLRYMLLEDYCSQHNIAHLAVAHHQDDQAETFLMRLMRGSGVDGLRCMQSQKQHGTIILLRPLLKFSALSIRKYLINNNIDWIEDPTNQNMAFGRNRVRSALKNALPPSQQHLVNLRLANTASSMQRAADALQWITEKAYAECVSSTNFTEKTLSIPLWKSFPQEIRLRVLSRVLCELSPQEKPLRLEKLERLETCLLTEEKFRAQLAQCEIILNEKSASIFRQSPKI
jgi:tRNA(Ile)-lysidine synthase